MSSLPASFKKAFDSIPISILTLDSDLSINYANTAALRLINKPIEQIIGKRLGDSIDCINSNENGCGFGSSCVSCQLREALINAVSYNKFLENAEINIHHVENGTVKDSWYKITLSQLSDDNRKNIIVTLMDITPKKKEELSLIRARDYSRNILNHVSAMIWKIDRNNKIEYVNKRWEEFTGISNDALKGTRLEMIIFPDDLDKFNKKIEKSVQDKSPFEMELRLKRKDGMYRSCLLTAVPSYDLMGEYDGYVATILDISDHKKAIDSLNQYQRLAESTSDIILFIDMEGKIIDANNAAVQSYGYSYEELQGMDIRKIKPDWGSAEARLKVSGDSSIHYETVHMRKDGSQFNVEVNAQLTAMDGNEIITSIVRDITAKKTAEQKLKDQEELFRTVFEQTSVGIIFGNKKKNLLMCNPRFEEILGRSKKELEKLHWTQYTHPEDIEKEQELLEKYKKGEINGYSLNKRYIRPDGSIVWVNLTISPIKVLSWPDIDHVGTVEDITERIKAEMDLRESERSKSVLLSNLPGMAYRCNYDRDWTMQFVSDGCYELTGYKPESLLNNRDLSFNDLIAPEYREYLWNKWTEILPKGGVIKEEYPITTATGEIKWVL